VTVNGNRTGLDFTSGFSVIINATAGGASRAGSARPAGKQASP
jgi:hypothetical protein